MTVMHLAGDVPALVARLQQAREACARFKPVHSPMTPAESAQRARIIETVVRTRKLLRWLQGSSDDPVCTARFP